MSSKDRLTAEKLTKAWRFFYKRGYVDGFGHISARTEDPALILVSRHSLGGKATPEDFVLVDFDGRCRQERVPLPAELPIHLEIYRARADVRSIAHFHCLYSTAFSMTACALKPTYFLASIFREGVPIHPDSRLINDRDRGVHLARTLGTRRAALMKAHGVVVTGSDVEDMVAGAFILEDNAQRTWISASVGTPEYLSETEMEEIEGELLKTRGPFRRIWALCEQEAEE